MKDNNAEIVNKRYFAISCGIRTARQIALLFLTVFLFCMYFLYSDSMTVDHFKYFIRNLKFDPSAVFSVGDKVYFDSGRVHECESFKGGFAVLGEENIDLYDMTSSTVLSEYHGYRSPSMALSDKYMLVFDRRGSGFSVYSAFSRLKEFDTESKITHAALSDEGTFAVAFTGDEYYSSVLVYNSNFKLINRLDKYKYVTSMDISSDGKTLLVCSVYSDSSGALTSEAMLIRTGDSKAKAEISVGDSVIYDSRFFDDGSFVLITDKAMRFYSAKGEYKESYRYGYGFPDHFFVSGGSIIFVYDGDAVNNKCTLVSYDNKGEHTCTVELIGTYRDMCASTHEAFVLLDTGVYRVSLKSGKAVFLDKNEHTYTDRRDGIIMGAAGEVYVTSALGAARLSDQP